MSKEIKWVKNELCIKWVKRFLFTYLSSWNIIIVNSVLGIWISEGHSKFLISYLTKAFPWRCSLKKYALKNSLIFTGKHLWRNLFLIKLQTHSLQLYYRKALDHVLSCKFCKVFSTSRQLFLTWLNMWRLSSGCRKC